MRRPPGFDYPVRLSSEIQSDPSSLGGPNDDFEMRLFKLSEGVDLLVSRGHFKEPLNIRMLNDDLRVQFSYTLKGRAEFEIDGLVPWGRFPVCDGIGMLHHTAGRVGRFSQSGPFAGVSILVEPNAFIKLDTGETKRNRHVAEGKNFFSVCNGIKEMELHRTARLLHGHGFCTEERGSHSQLWLQGQGMTFMALFLESSDEAQANDCSLSHDDRQKLMRARDLLLADLSRAPSLADLAGQCGLGLVKLKKGFRSLFGSSAYGLYLQERMHEARRRLESEGESVTAVALDLGYSNISHFAAAFRKQFGINPAQLKGRRTNASW